MPDFLDKTFCASGLIDNIEVNTGAFFLVRTGNSVLNMKTFITVDSKVRVDGFKNPTLVEPGQKTPMEMSRPDDRNLLNLDVEFFIVPGDDISDLGSNKWNCATDFIPYSGYRKAQERMKLLENTDHLLRIIPKIGSCDVFVKFVCTTPEK